MNRFSVLPSNVTVHPDDVLMAGADACPLNTELSAGVLPSPPLVMAPAPVDTVGAPVAVSQATPAAAASVTISTPVAATAVSLSRRGGSSDAVTSPPGAGTERSTDRFTVGQQNTRLGMSSSAPADRFTVRQQNTRLGMSSSAPAGRYTAGRQNTWLGMPSSAPATSIAGASTADANTVLRSPPPQYILVGDSMIRSVAIPNGITYSFSGAKILDLHKHISAIADCHPSAHTIIVHCGVNNLRCRQSTKLRADYKQLADLIESLGRTCIFSGLIPSLRRGSEFF